MILSSLPSCLPKDKEAIVGIIGNSHSGILACMNFHTIATRPSHSQVHHHHHHDTNSDQSGMELEGRNVKIINFQRREILFAEYREDGIVWDNSGLKGRTADWAKANMLEHESEVIQQVRLDKYEGGEEAAYRHYLPECTHLVYAVGYDQSPLPRLTLNGRRIETEMEFDMHTSGFTIPHTAQSATRTQETRTSSGSDQSQEARRRVHGLYGTGIAFPEETEDPEGHLEAAVGLAKFFKFAERVKGDWGVVA